MREEGGRGQREREINKKLMHKKAKSKPKH